jgi:replicative DNA helicase
MTGGLHKGELVILAARPSMGKSSLMLNIAGNVSLKSHKRVVVFSLEDSREACLQRMMCGLARIDSHKYRQGYLNKVEREKLNMALHKLTESTLLIDDSAPLTVMDLRARLGKIIQKHGPVDLVCVDYLQLMANKGKAENRVQEVGANSRGLKLMAKELQIPFVVLSQLSRAVEQRKDDHRPKLSDLRESGNIEQDADVVGFIYRPEVYHPDRQELKNQAELIVAKQRHGPVGTVHLVWLPGITKFENKTEDEAPEFDHGD